MTTVEPTYSVILPTCDRPELLQRAIDSVIAQTAADWELIVVDDGSFVPAIVPDDERIRLIRIENNRGPSTARNAGLREATGKYVTFLDDDDAFTPDRLERAGQGLGAGEISVCWARFEDEHRGGGRTLDGWAFEEILDESTPTLGCGLYPRDLVPLFDERWHAVEDIVWWMEMSRRAPVVTVAHVGYLVGRHDGPRRRNHLSARIEENLRLIDEEQAYFDEHPAALAFRWKRIGLMARAIGDGRQARAAFRRSLAHQPGVISLWHLARSMFS